jgi:hypothetical protein
LASSNELNEALLTGGHPETPNPKNNLALYGPIKGAILADRSSTSDSECDPTLPESISLRPNKMIPLFNPRDVALFIKSF